MPGERCTLSEHRDPDGHETLPNMELLRLTLPRRVFTLSQLKYAVIRVAWLYENRKPVDRLEFLKEPPILRFFSGTLMPASGRQQTLVAKSREDFGGDLHRPLLGVEQSLVLVRLEELVADRALKGLAEWDDGGEAGLTGRRGELRVRAELPDAHRADREPAASYSPCEIE
jgi:hypothetical protein